MHDSSIGKVYHTVKEETAHKNVSSESIFWPNSNWEVNCEKKVNFTIRSKKNGKLDKVEGYLVRDDTFLVS